MIAKDNVDINVKPSTAKQHFRGTSMSVLQFPSRRRDNSFIQNYLHRQHRQKQ